MHDAYPDRPLFQSPFSDPRVNCWYPKLTPWSHVRSEFNPAISGMCIAALSSTIAPLAELDDGVTHGIVNMGEKKEQTTSSVRTKCTD